MKPDIIGVLFAAGLGLAVASPAEAADHIADKSPLLSDNDALWVLPTLLIAAFAAGYSVRSLVSSRRHRRALRSKFGDLTPSHRLQVQPDNSQLSLLSLVPRDDVGDLQSPQPPTAARPRQSS